MHPLLLVLGLVLATLAAGLLPHPSPRCIRGSRRARRTGRQLGAPLLGLAAMVLVGAGLTVAP